MTTLWDQFYSEQGRFFLTPHESFKNAVLRFKSFDVKNILDLGCGSGRHVVAFAEKGFNVTGVDSSPIAVDLAQKWLINKNLEGEVVIGDIDEKLEFAKEASYDAVLAINSLHYLDDERIESNFKEINRVLKTGGLLYLVLPTENSTITEPEKSQKFFTIETIKPILERTFRILEIKHDKENNIVVFAQEY